jgi:hypothetical protein
VPKARPPSISWRPWWLRGPLGRWLLRSIVLLALVAGVLGAVIWLSHWAQQRIHDDPRYLVPFAEIVVDPPKDMEPAAFLDEVRYYGQVDEKPLNLLDEDLPPRLRHIFAKHPWVEKVDEVTVRPPRRIEVTLTYRTPVLAVRWDGRLRAVDGQGVLLPKNAPAEKLPVFEGEPKRPQGPGQRWGDPEVEQAAKKLAGKI